MKTLRLAVAFGTALATTTIALADSPEALELRGVRIEIPTLAAAQASDSLSALAARASSRHAIVRLVDDLDPAGRERIANEGIRLLSCLAPRTWVVAIDPMVADRAGMFMDRVAWAGALPRSAKLHPFLADGGVPEWTVDRRDLDAFIAGREADINRVIEQIGEADDPIVALYVLAHKDIALDDFAAMLEIGGIEIRSRMRTVNGLLVRTRMSGIDRILDLDETLWIEPALPPLTTNNDSNRVNTQVDQVHQAPYELDGEGVVVMVYDGGHADASHSDFGGRLTVRDSSGQSTHGTHVSGTVGGDGANSGGTNKGMAPAVTIESYGFEQPGGLSEGFLYTDPGDLEADYSDAINNWGAVVANNSIGTNTAPNGFPCEWTGDYGVTSNLIDSVVRGDLGGDIRIVWANGNERQTTRCGDLYNTTAPPACAKNHITVGATNSDDDSITTFTSWGPADDGRIKPDLTAPGCQSDGDGGVTSTFPGGGYGTYCGTSMASPTVTGIAALVVQEWRRLHPGEADLSNAAVKALLANSGADLGNVGPDCQYGFGTVRARDAIDSLRADGVIESEVGNGGVGEHLVIVPAGESMLRITLAWDDEPASPLPLAALVNDLDLVVTSPGGQVFDPWTIDPADPGAPATRSGRDRLNNMEQVSVENPTPGAWRIQVVGHAVPVGPQEYALSANPNPIACSSTGVVGFSGQRVQPETVVSINAVDCDLNTDDAVTDTVAVKIWSDDDPIGFDTVLTEDDPASSSFAGSIQLTLDPAGFGLHVLDGSQFYVEYIDEMDASGNTDVSVIASALVDGRIDAPESVDTVEFGPDSATIQILSDEPIRVTVLYGDTCGNLDREQVSSSFATDQQVTISGLEDTFTYYFRVIIEDLAGNSENYGDGSNCFVFTVPDALDFYAEQFGGSIDLQDSRIRFIPIDSADVYAPCFESGGSLPYEPSGGNSISLGDDSFSEVSIPFSFTFYGSSYDTAYVGSNGYLTFGSGDSTYNESFGAHFDRPRISMLFDDLNPTAGGSVNWKTIGDAFVVTWDGVAEYGSTNSNTFQIALFPSGEFLLAWGGLEVSDAIIGLSPGGGLASNFIENDLSSGESGCLPRPPLVQDVQVSTGPGSPVDITLVGSDDGQPLPMIYVIDDLPLHDLRDLSTGELIATVPHVIASMDGPHLRYEPLPGWEGSTNFAYHADDGGSPPEGGPSNDALVSITVASGPRLIRGWDMSSNPDWSLDAGWGFGQPQGAGGDPFEGATGANVIGYELGGQYGNNLPERHATSPSVDCSKSTGTTLRFHRWLGVESASYDHAYVRVSVDGGSSWSTIWSHEEGSFSDTNWQAMEYDISGIADGRSDVRIRFTMGTTDGSVTYCGWNVDDVEIFGVIPNEGIPGDLNGDGQVNGADLGLLFASWGPCTGCAADLNGDGVVGGADVGLLLLAYGSGGFDREGASSDDRSDVVETDQDPVDPSLADRHRHRIVDGLLVASNGFRMGVDSILSVGIEGADPISGHDLVVVRGEAIIAGRLEIETVGFESTDDFIAVVMIADSILGDFHEIVATGHRSDIVVCTTPSAVLVRFGGESPIARSLDDPAIPAEALDLIDAIGGDHLEWDLDGDGTVTTSDLGVLLDIGRSCP